jgi:hypothetical protein
MSGILGYAVNNKTARSPPHRIAEIHLSLLRAMH